MRPIYYETDQQKLVDHFEVGGGFHAFQYYSLIIFETSGTDWLRKSPVLCRTHRFVFINVGMRVTTCKTSWLVRNKQDVCVFGLFCCDWRTLKTKKNLLLWTPSAFFSIVFGIFLNIPGPGLLTATTRVGLRELQRPWRSPLARMMSLWSCLSSVMRTPSTACCLRTLFFIS